MEGLADVIFVKSFTQARFQQIWKFTPIMRKPRHVLPPKTPFKSKQMWDSPTVLLIYVLSLLYNIKLVKNYKNIFEITQDMSSPAEILPNIEIIYTSAACDACDKYHVWEGRQEQMGSCFQIAVWQNIIPVKFEFLHICDWMKAVCYIRDSFGIWEEPGLQGAQSVHPLPAKPEWQRRKGQCRVSNWAIDAVSEQHFQVIFWLGRASWTNSAVYLFNV